MVNEERIVQEFLELVQIDSPSWQEKELAEVLKAKLEALGCQVMIDDTAEKINGTVGNLVARLEPNNGKENYIFFSAHMDTVQPGEGVKPIIENGIIKSSGDTILGGDDKAGIVSILEMLKIVKEQNIKHSGIEIVFTVCEEQGLLGSSNFDTALINAKSGYILDSGGPIGDIVIKGPAQNRLEVKIKGKAAHAGMCPEQGISAVQVAARAIAEMKLGRIDAETTANIGIIQGGKAINIVPDEVELKGEARSLDLKKLEEQTQHMVDLFKTMAEEVNAEAEITIKKLYANIDIDIDSSEVKAIITACESLGIDPKLVTTGGGSDANILCGKGLQAINLSVGMTDVHTTNESIAIVDLITVPKLLVQILQQMA